MSLDFAECDRARMARDPKYDGRFYTGVRSTGIYCRPVCPVRPARSVNVTFFPSAAAAEVAGFRPCLRCRPETAPFSSAWIGSRATVVRAMRLIVEDGALDQDGATVEHLAARLGMGSRQLRRLFARHLHASPSKIARTARVQRAKRLIDETGQSMTEIAIRASCVTRRCASATRQVWVNCGYPHPASAISNSCLQCPCFRPCYGWTATMAVRASYRHDTPGRTSLSCTAINMVVN